MEKTEKLMDREIAWRIFAHEFNMSNLYVSEGDERAPNYIITPTGVKCNRLFIIGVVTEVENIGRTITSGGRALPTPQEFLRFTLASTSPKQPYSCLNCRFLRMLHL